MYADEETLNLLSPATVRRLCERCGLAVSQVKLRYVFWFGMPSNLVLCIRD